MGIDGLKKFIKETVPESFIEIEISKIKNGKIAIDANNWMCKNWARAVEEVVRGEDIIQGKVDDKKIQKVWHNKALMFISSFLKYQVGLIWVFDGEHPDEKKKTKDERKRKRQEIKESLENQKKEFCNQNCLEIDEKHIRQLERTFINSKNIPWSYYKEFKDFLINLGLPVIQARGDGERVCSILCLKNLVTAVYSDDSDNIAFCCPLLITGKSQRNSEGDLVFPECIRTDVILEKFGWNSQQFLDFCILCGTDFNERIPLVGPKKAFGLIEKYGSIDGLPNSFREKIEEKINKKIEDHLNLESCRKLFSCIEPNELVEELNLDPKVDDEEQILFTIQECQSKVNGYTFFALLEETWRYNPDLLENLNIKRMEPFFLERNGMKYFYCDLEDEV